MWIWLFFVFIYLWWFLLLLDCRKHDKKHKKEIEALKAKADERIRQMYIARFGRLPMKDVTPRR